MRKHALRRALLCAAVTATTIAAGAVDTLPAYAEAGTSSIIGHLTEAGGGPAAGALVNAQTSAGDFGASTYTDAAGAYVLPNLPAGAFLIRFQGAASTFFQWAHQKTSPFQADPVTVGAGATVVVDEQLVPLGKITGHLRNHDGTVPQGYVNAYLAADHTYVDNRGIAPDGAFVMDLPAGVYKLDFRVRNAFDQYSGGAQTFESAAPVTVTVGQTVQDEETVLPTGSIGGRLTGADGTAAAGVSVNAIVADSGISIGFGTTDADGRYTFNDLLLRDYQVSFTGPQGAPQYAHGKLAQADAQRFAVTDGQLTTVDETFLPTGGIRVVAHDATTGEVVPNVCVYSAANSIGGCGDGAELVLDKVFVGTYHFEVTLSDAVHFGVPDVAVTVTAGQTATVELSLRRGASILASMVQRDGGGSVDGCVDAAAVNDEFAYSPYGFCSDWTPGPAPGAVRIGPLEAGTYQLFANPRSDALGMQWVGAAGGTGNREAAQQFTLSAGQQFVAPAVQFDKAGTIRGKVTDFDTGAPVQYACVWPVALDSLFNGSGDCPASTGADGTYSIPGVGPYAWPVEFAASGHQWRWSGNAVNRRAATTVTVPAGKKVAANIKVRTGGGTLTGLIHDAAGHPVSAFVTAVDAVSGEPVAFGGGITPEQQPPATYTIANIAPQAVRIHYRTEDGRSGWVGGADFTHAQQYQIRNAKTLTVAITVQ